jgi:Putative HNHc nuclease
LRDRLIAEVRELGSSDDAATWAHKILAEKNTLIAEDAQVLEDAFQARLEAIGADGADPFKGEGQNLAPPTPRERNEMLDKPKHRRRSQAIDKSVPPMPEPRRLRDRDHVRSVAQRPCLICGRQPADAHHLRFAQNRALARKVSDEFTVPLCRGHHREVHRYGDEAVWWRNAGIDPTIAARSLWLESHPLLGVDRNQRCLAMEEYRRRLERTQLKIYAALLVLLFGGLLMLPRIGQLIWIVVIMAIYIRVLGDIADFGNASQASL